MRYFEIVKPPARHISANAEQRDAAGGLRGGRAVQRSIHDAHGEDCTDAAEGDAMPTI